MAISKKDLLKELLPKINEAFSSAYEKLIEYDYAQSHDPQLKKNVWVVFRKVDGIRMETVGKYDTEEEATGICKLMKGV